MYVRGECPGFEYLSCSARGEGTKKSCNYLRSSVLPRTRKFAAILFLLHDVSADAFSAALIARLHQP